MGDVFDLFTRADSITATLVALTVIYTGTRTLLSRTVGRRRDLRKRLCHIAPEVNEEYVRSLFGAPAYGELIGGAGVLTWDTDSGYLAIEFLQSRAQLIEFTLTELRLRFPLATFTKGIAAGRLGRDTFTQLLPDHDHSEPHRYSLGARRFYYAEKAYIGNPGGYCTAYLAVNDAGVAPKSGPAPSLSSAHYWPPEQARVATEAEARFFKRLSREMQPNSVAVAGIGYRGSYNTQLVDLDVVRLLSWPGEPSPLRRMLAAAWRRVRRGREEITK
jgi:hypothetical protein